MCTSNLIVVSLMSVCFASTKRYVHNLRIVVESIMKPLLQLAEDPRKPTIVPADTVTKIFRNVDMILNFNEKLLTALTTCGAVENKVTEDEMCF